MRILKHNEPGFDTNVREVLQRRGLDPTVEKAAADILEAVRQRGDAALAEFARRFDKVTLTPAEFAVSAAEIAAAEKTLTPKAKTAIRQACRQVQAFARQQKRRAWSFSPRRGVRLGEKYVPLSRVAVYIPGGTAPLVSTILHTAAIAQTAGVAEIVMLTPPRPDKSVHPAMLYAAKLAGVTEVYRLGGVYGVAAAAYGTATIRPVEKIVGPGNAYVTAAKRQVYGQVALDLVAGPSEILVIADATAEARFVAADMLSQIEHGSGREQAVLITTCEKLIPAVQAELKKQTASLSRAACIAKPMDTGVFMIVAKSLEQAADLASLYAPEHLEIMTREPRQVAARITAAGAIFLGPWTPEPVGDFVAGPSHVLPTGGAARYFSGLTLEQFMRRMSVVEYSREALLAELPAIAEFAAMEGLDAHGRSASIRATASPAGR